MKRKIKIIQISFIITLIVAAAVVFVANPRGANAAYDVSFANFWIGKITPGKGHVGVDIWWPGSGSEYNPCHNSNDIYYGACQFSNNGTASYYKVLNYNNGSTDFPYGIFIDNQNANHCTTSSWCNNKIATSFTHDWAKIITDGSIEVYPYDATNNYNPSNNTVGGVRIKTSFFNFANGGRYSPKIGDVSLPQLGNPGVAKLNGFVTNGGGAVATNRVLFEAFQRDTTSKTSTGFPMYGFTTGQNNSDRYYNTGAVPAGSYKIYITDTATNHKIILDGINIFSPYERLDFKLDQRCFGYPNSNCTDPAS